MSELDVNLAGKSLADYTNTQLRLALGAVLYTNTADMWKRYLNQLGYSGDVSQMLQKYYVEYSVPQNFRNYINAGAFIYSPQQLFTDGSKGLFFDNNDFVEPTSWRRNLLTYSEQFDNAIWTQDNVSVSANADSAPNSTTTADKIIPSAVSTFHRIRIIGGGTGQFTFSAYVKASGYNFVKLRLAANWVNFNLSAGTIGLSSGDAGSIQDVGGGWYRCSVSANLASANTAFIYPMPTNDAATDPTFTGDGTSGVLTWGAQLETGASATTYQRITDFNSEFLAAFPSTTLFLDSAGTTPATVNGLVGLQLDKSANLALGAELLASGVIALTGVATAATYSTTTGVGTVTRVDASNQSYVTWTGLDATAYYQITISNTGAGLLYVRTGAGIGLVVVTISAGNTVTCSVLASGSAISIAADSGTANFTLGTIKKLPGNHRYQTTTGSKPVLRGTPTGANLVTNGDFASGTGWTLGTGITISAGKLNFATADAVPAAENVAQVVSGKVYKAVFTVSGYVSGGVSLANNNSSTSVGNVYAANGTHEQYFTATQSGSIFIRARTGATTLSVDDFTLFDVSAGSVTAPYGLQYDGVDDFMQTAAVDFTATDKMFVCAGVRKLSDAAVGVLLESSVNMNSNAGAFYITMPNNTSGINAFASRGSVLPAGGAASTATAPLLAVITGIADIAGDSQIQRRNGTQVASAADDQGTGNYGNYALYFGRRGGASLPYNGLDFGLVICGKTLTSTQISQTERYIAQRTGIAL